MRIDTNVNNSVKPASGKDDLALKKACRDFESLLVAQMLKEMNKSVPKNDLFGSKEKEEIWQGMLDDEVAKQISKSGAMGLGDTIYVQLLRIKENAKVPDESVEK